MMFLSAAAAAVRVVGCLGMSVWAKLSLVFQLNGIASPPLPLSLPASECVRQGPPNAVPNGVSPGKVSPGFHSLQFQLGLGRNVGF